MVRGRAEDLRLNPTGDGGTRLNYTTALDNRLLRVLPVPSWLQRLQLNPDGRILEPDRSR